MCGPFCSIPPLGTITVVQPRASALHTSTRVGDLDRVASRASA